MTPPVFAHGHLRLYLLSLLAERPMHGYELIQALSDRFGGTYVPSAGTIYPRLSKLEDDGLVTKESDGRKTVYSITDSGRRELAAREGELGGIEDELSDSVRRLANEVRTSVNDAMKTLRADLAAAARDARVETRTEARADARRERAEGSHAESGTPTGTTGDDVRVEARMALRDAEAALNDFRQQLRADLRTEAARGRLTASTVTMLTTRLTELRREITVALRG
jgi:DNA-binding PadR family transcriptional regulator